MVDNYRLAPPKTGRSPTTATTSCNSDNDRRAGIIPTIKEVAISENIWSDNDIREHVEHPEYLEMKVCVQWQTLVVNGPDIGIRGGF